MLNPGTFNRLVEIHFPVEKEFDESGFLVEGNEPKIKRVWAAVFPVNSYEYQNNNAENERKDTTRFVVRYQGNTDINLQCKVVYREKEYNLTSLVEDYDSRRTIALFGQEVAQDEGRI